MILEGFTIENFSCIKHLEVEDLPTTGVIVLHGPNGTGKSSILEALRACLMDNKSTSRALARGFPKNSTEKPRVTVVFRAKGTTWKIMKQFGSKDSTLHSRTPSGEWKLETNDPSEAHERTRQLAGGSDSTLGLSQLLWLTQAEFHLPEPKKFDADVQSRLREILGVLQTPLDDRFLSGVKQEWSRWFGARNKPGEKPKLKKDCPLEKALTTLKKQETELIAIETEFQAFERLMEASSDLEIQVRDLRRQLEAASSERDGLQKEFEHSLKPIELHRLAVEGVASAERDLITSQVLRQRHTDLECRWHDSQKAAANAQQVADEERSKLDAAEQSLRLLRLEVHDLRHRAHELQAQRDAVSNRLSRLALREQTGAARVKLRQAEQENGELEVLKQQARDHPAPDAVTLQKLADNGKQADLLRAELIASAIALTLILDVGATDPLIVLDGKGKAVGQSPTDAPIECSIRRRAEIGIPGWGRIEVKRGADVRSLDQIEGELGRLEQAAMQTLATFGIPMDHPAPLERLREFAAEKKLRDPQMERKRNLIEELAPAGLEPLRQELARLENLSAASESAGTANPDLPVTAAELGQLADRLKEALDTNQVNIAEIDEQIAALDRQIEGTGAKLKIAGKVALNGLRQSEAAARDVLTTLNTTTASLLAELDRMLTAEQIEGEVRDAERKVALARDRLASAQLSESEETIGDRLASAKEGVRGLEGHLKRVEKDFNQISGQLRTTAGLHQKRSAAKARVEELERLTEREMLDSEAYDRLYGLFEECREKQLGAVMGPIHDRVLRWMKLSRIPGYQSIRFNDQFLPEHLITRDGASEMRLDEESVGTREQLALMVRLALGAAISTLEEPVVAMLDDPLAYSDGARLDRMRAVLRNAAAGETGAPLSAGPLQIFVFTCHPEWFAINGAKIIDLGKPEVLSRSAF